MGNLQAHAIQALVTELNMNSYCLHDWFRYLKYKCACNQYLLISLKLNLNLNLIID
jgi:hypothetical protein